MSKIIHILPKRRADSNECCSTCQTMCKGNSVTTESTNKNIIHQMFCSQRRVYSSSHRQMAAEFRINPNITYAVNSCRHCASKKEEKEKKEREEAHKENQFIIIAQSSHSSDTSFSLISCVNLLTEIFQLFIIRFIRKYVSI